ncbi:MAG: insulinase family protein [Firmicutes bacterium]|nr:insulinase family protein [Bacillota bacterium]
MIRKDVLSNGLRVVTDYMPDAYSVTTSLWAGTGSAYEEAHLGGISHVVEHMLFKGTNKRNYQQIAHILEDVGGQMNAFTSREYTCYYTRSLGENFELCLDILSDMYLDSQFPAEEWAKEKGVILEEINMYEDTPDDLVGEMFNRKLLPTHPYGLPVIGTAESVSSFTREHIDAYCRSHYAPQHTVLAVAGNVPHEDVMRQAEKYLAGGKFTAEAWDKPKLTAPEYGAGLTYVHKDIEQIHITLGVPGLAGDDEDIYALNLLNSILGGGVSSRLFQEVREKRGLTYSVYSSVAAQAFGGSFSAYASTSPKRVDELLKVLGYEMAKIAADGVTEEELARAQAQFKAGLLMGLESSANVMVRLGRTETVYGRVQTVDEQVAEIMQVDCAAVQRLAGELLQPNKLVLSMVGPNEPQVDLQGLLSC